MDFKDFMASMDSLNFQRFHGFHGSHGFHSFMHSMDFMGFMESMDFMDSIDFMDFMDFLDFMGLMDLLGTLLRSVRKAMQTKWRDFTSRNMVQLRQMGITSAMAVHVVVFTRPVLLGCLQLATHHSTKSNKGSPPNVLLIHRLSNKP